MRSAPSEGIKSNRKEVEVAPTSGYTFIKNGGVDVMKVASSSTGGGSFIKEDTHLERRNSLGQPAETLLGEHVTQMQRSRIAKENPCSGET